MSALHTYKIRSAWKNFRKFDSYASSHTRTGSWIEIEFHFAARISILNKKTMNTFLEPNDRKEKSIKKKLFNKKILFFHYSIPNGTQCMGKEGIHLPVFIFFCMEKNESLPLWNRIHFKYNAKCIKCWKKRFWFDLNIFVVVRKPIKEKKRNQALIFNHDTHVQFIIVYIPDLQRRNERNLTEPEWNEKKNFCWNIGNDGTTPIHFFFIIRCVEMLNNTIFSTKQKSKILLNFLFHSESI